MCDDKINIDLIKPEDVNCTDCKYMVLLDPRNVEFIEFFNQVGFRWVGAERIDYTLPLMALKILEIQSMKHAEFLEKIVVVGETIQDHLIAEFNKGK